LEPAQQVERRLRRALCTAGLQEVCSLSLVAAAEGRVPLANPLLADYGHLRDDLHSELLAAARRNLQSGQVGFWCFEIGQVFQVNSGPENRQLLSGVLAGERRSERWTSTGKPKAPTYFEARGVLAEALKELAIPIDDRVLAGHGLLHPGRAAELVVEGRPVGWFGQLHPEHAEAMDLPEATFVFELDLQALLTSATRKARLQPSFRPFATVPASERDLAVVVPNDAKASELMQVMRKAGKPLLEHVELIDRYEGEQVGEGLCSQAFRLRYRHPDRTLTDEEVDGSHGAIRAALEQQMGAQLRC
jgi:phenylalanyl-tRNA synthetase beta chain